jgi:hypothetical protein
LIDDSILFQKLPVESSVLDIVADLSSGSLLNATAVFDAVAVSGAIAILDTVALLDAVVNSVSRGGKLGRAGKVGKSLDRNTVASSLVGGVNGADVAQRLSM